MARALALQGADCNSLARRYSRALLLLATAGLINACGGGSDGPAPATSETSGQTSGEVIWLDSAGYTKPAFYPISVPDEASVANKYYIDLTSGSGLTCSQASPCAGFNQVAGKAGTNGGPAYVYLKGSGRLDINGITINGSSGNEIVIKPWPGATAAVTMTTTGSCTVGGANLISGPNVHHLILDGGPSMLFRFTGANCTGENGYTLVVQSSNIKIARVRVTQGAGGGPAYGPGVGSGTYVNSVYLINSEIYDVTNNFGAAYGVYSGGGTGCAAGNTGHDDLRFINNIIRNIYNNAIQIEPRDFGSNTYIEGNAIHTIATTGGDRNAITVTDACSGTLTNTFIRNNLFFNMGFGAIGFDSIGGTSGMQVISNTIYDYAQVQTETLLSHGITSYTDGEAATVHNNILVNSNSNSGVFACNRTSGWTVSHNLIGDPITACGTSGRTGTAAGTFQSINSADSTFLWLRNTGNAFGTGLSVNLSVDYLGQPRLLDLATEIGAIEFGPGP
jgi:hypothetical protein